MDYVPDRAGDDDPQIVDHPSLLSRTWLPDRLAISDRGLGAYRQTSGHVWQKMRN
jgi:hypothetical protein